MVISVSSQKGGVAKTTTVLAMASAFTKLGLKVLMVDLDGQWNLTQVLAIDKAPAYTIGEVIRQKCKLKDAIISIDGYGDVVCGSPMMDSISINHLHGHNHVLKKVLTDIKPYDVVLLDTPPSLGDIMINALMFSDCVLVPVQADAFSSAGLTDMMDTVATVQRYGNTRLKVLGLVLTAYDGRSKLSKTFLKLYQDYVIEQGIYLFTIPKGIAIKEAAALHEPLHEYAPKSKPAIAYMEMCDTLAREVLKNG